MSTLLTNLAIINLMGRLAFCSYAPIVFFTTVCCISSGSFPDIWKYADVHPVLRKDNYQLKNNSLLRLPICGNILGKIIFDKVLLFKYQ